MTCWRGGGGGMSGMRLNYKYKSMGIANDSTYGIHQSAVTLSQKANLAAAGRYQSRVSLNTLSHQVMLFCSS